MKCCHRCFNDKNKFVWTENAYFIKCRHYNWHSLLLSISVTGLHSKILDVPPRVQILSISCRFWENLAKSYVGTPGGLVPPPRGNPGSASGIVPFAHTQYASVVPLDVTCWVKCCSNQVKVKAMGLKRFRLK